MNCTMFRCRQRAWKVWPRWRRLSTCRWAQMPSISLRFKFVLWTFYIVLLQSVRVPIVEETCPSEVCFDLLVDSLKQVKYTFHWISNTCSWKHLKTNKTGASSNPMCLFLSSWTWKDHTWYCARLLSIYIAPLVYHTCTSARAPIPTSSLVFTHWIVSHCSQHEVWLLPAWSRRSKSARSCERWLRWGSFNLKW